MTYPPSPYGGRPGLGQQQPHYAQPQGHGVPEQHYYAPQGPAPWRPDPNQGRKKSNAPSIILAVVLVVLVGGGLSAWLFWPKERAPQQIVVGGTQGRPGADRTTGASGRTPQAEAKPSLRGRSKEDLLKALPTLQDMPTGWKELTQGSVSSGVVDPEGCAHVLPKGQLTPVINRYFGDPGDQFKSSIEVYLFEWNAEPQLDKVRDYIGRCATYRKTTSGTDGNPGTVLTINVKEVGLPKTAADSSIAYEETGTISPAPEGGNRSSRRSGICSAAYEA
ncbi:hypothetical protein [Segniliparus rugosus]|uniref:Uncharacterized protein n=1 Tax=Segniliparus rugosus (strain ATCC BAA-974 / DSM 45345 / CCUG 50838 / CIP 108380 / JCM 13579 / CDC 945) TaxID=679197 RepID=U1M1W5_SEGRC|nr:hypothetical protein [Segniliparus rugosus]ERG69362.1 hypothetical protein HMPREF9336_04058 [Segniliparus rugosus ATCC BAA-974]